MHFCAWIISSPTSSHDHGLSECDVIGARTDTPDEIYEDNQYVCSNSGMKIGLPSSSQATMLSFTQKESNTVLKSHHSNKYWMRFWG
jgi:hypothetical protein